MTPASTVDKATTKPPAIWGRQRACVFQYYCHANAAPEWLTQQIDGGVTRERAAIQAPSISRGCD